MEIPKLSGYYININSKSYNKLKRIESGKFINLIDIYKEVVLKNGKLENAPKVDKNDVYSGEVGDAEYEPIGYRIGDKRNNFNSVLFSNFTIGKNLKNKCNNTNNLNEISMNPFPNLYGIIYNDCDGNSIKISIDNLPTTYAIENNHFNLNSKLFFENFQDIQIKLNQNSCLSIGQINLNNNNYNNNNANDQNIIIPGLINFDDTNSIENRDSIYKLFEQDPIKFLKNYCQNSNNDYLEFKRFILKMHSIFNLLIWDLDLIYYPFILLLISSIYNEINEQHRNYQGTSKKLEYILNLSTIQINNFNQTNDKFQSIFIENNQFQSPCLINITLNIQDDKLSSLLNQDQFKLIKSLLKFNDGDVKNKCLITLNINEFDDNLDLISNLSNEIFKNNFNGLLLKCDRKESNNDPNKKPSTIKFDQTLSNFYSKENQIKTNNFIESLNNINNNKK